MMRRDKVPQSSALCPANIPTSHLSFLDVQVEKLASTKNHLLKPSFFIQLVLLALLGAFFPGSTLHAQTGLLTGTVVDPSGAAIPGAQIQIINQARGNLTRKTPSNPGAHSPRHN